MKRGFVVIVVAVSLATPGCAGPAPAKTYALTGQVLSVSREHQLITINHEDIDGLMAGMTMSFPVARPGLLDGREPGELIKATLDVTDALGRITAVERVGFRALPAGTDAAATAGAILDVGDAVPDAAFIDQANRRRAFAEWRGAATLVTFTYTRCPLPTFCPLIDRHLATIQRAILDEPGLRGRARLVSISFDPDHDTPKVLAAHAGRLKADAATWTFLTGDRAAVDRFAAALGVGVMREDDQSITHNLRTILVGADGRIAHVYSGNEWTTAAVLADLRVAARAARLP